MPLQGAIEKMIAGYKDQQLVSLEASLANLVAQLFMEVGISKFSAILSPARNAKNFRKRGFDPAFRLARQAVRQLPSGVNVHALKPTRKLEDQRRLGKLARETNVANSMRLGAHLTGPVLLFDDVLTTGSTIQEMARACHVSGVEVAGCCVLAQRKSNY
jgi:predicted amidophosphoribosyltransferase